MFIIGTNYVCSYFSFMRQLKWLDHMAFIIYLCLSVIWIVTIQVFNKKCFDFLAKNERKKIGIVFYLGKIKNMISTSNDANMVMNSNIIAVWIVMCYVNYLIFSNSYQNVILWCILIIYCNFVCIILNKIKIVETFIVRCILLIGYGWIHLTLSFGPFINAIQFPGADVNIWCYLTMTTITFISLWFYQPSIAPNDQNNGKFFIFCAICLVMNMFGMSVIIFTLRDALDIYVIQLCFVITNLKNIYVSCKSQSMYLFLAHYVYVIAVISMIFALDFNQILPIIVPICVEYFIIIIIFISTSSNKWIKIKLLEGQDTHMKYGSSLFFISIGIIFVISYLVGSEFSWIILLTNSLFYCIILFIDAKYGEGNYFWLWDLLQIQILVITHFSVYFLMMTVMIIGWIYYFNVKQYVSPKHIQCQVMFVICSNYVCSYFSFMRQLKWMDHFAFMIYLGLSVAWIVTVQVFNNECFNVVTSNTGKDGSNVKRPTISICLFLGVDRYYRQYFAITDFQKMLVLENVGIFFQ